MTTMPVAELDDVALATRACGGDRAAFAALVDRHYDFIFAVAWRWCANRADAEDVAQDACIKLARALSGWRREGKFTTWLYRLVLSATHDLGRKREREMRKVQAFHAHALTEMQGPTDDGDSLDDLWDAVRELPPKQRDAVLLVYGEGITHGEAAQAMECSESTVSWHIHEAKKRLKNLIGEDDDQ